MIKERYNQHELNRLDFTFRLIFLSFSLIIFLTCVHVRNPYKSSTRSSYITEKIWFHSTEEILHKFAYPAMVISQTNVVSPAVKPVATTAEILFPSHTDFFFIFASFSTLRPQKITHIPATRVSAVNSTQVPRTAVNRTLPEKFYFTLYWYYELRE